MSLSEYSSCVILRLLVGGEEIALTHVGSGSVILRQPAASYPPTSAVLAVCVDGVAQERKVFLPHGIRPGNNRVRYF